MIAYTLFALASGSIALAAPTKTSRSGPIVLPFLPAGNATASYWHDLLGASKQQMSRKRAATTSRVTYNADSGAYFYAAPITIGTGTNAVNTLTQIDTVSSRRRIR